MSGSRTMSSKAVEPPMIIDIEFCSRAADASATIDPSHTGWAASSSASGSDGTDHSGPSVWKLSSVFGIACSSSMPALKAATCPHPR